MIRTTFLLNIETLSVGIKHSSDLSIALVEQPSFTSY
jgi:hypothetical protein